MTLLEQATHLQTLAHSPDILDALDTYYADDVTIAESSGETFTGRETQKGRVRDFMASLKAVHGESTWTLAVTETAPGTGVAFIESSDDMEFQDGTRMRLDEVAVQRWEAGKVVHERFYTIMPPAEPSA